MASEVINLNDTTPAPSPGFQNAKWQKGATTGNDPTYGVPVFPVSDEVPNTGGTVVHTGSYTAVAGDCGVRLVFNSATAVTLTLPATPPFAQWTISVQNIGAGVLTIARNGLLIDTAAANLTVPQNCGVDISTEGTNYFTGRGISNTAGMATQAGVQQESYISGTDTGTANAYVITLSPAPTMGLFSSIVFKAANTNTLASTVTVNGVTYPLTKNGTSPLSPGDIRAGQIVHGTLDASGNVQISAVPAATVLTPNRRGSNSATSTTGSITIALPTGSQAGDFALLYVANGFSPAVPSGWTTISPTPGSSVWFAFTASKLLTSGDISTGSITVGTGGVFNAVAEIYVFIGATGGVREFPRSDTPGGNYTTTLTTSSAVQASDVGVYFGSVRASSGPGSASVSPGSTLQSPSIASQCYGVLADQGMPGGATTVSFTYTNSIAASQIVVIVQGAATGVGSVTSVSASGPSFLTIAVTNPTSTPAIAITATSEAANLVLASPNGASGPMTPRALVPADMPVMGASGSSHAAGAVPDPGATAGTTKFLREDATFAVPPGSGGISLTTVGSSGAATLVGSTLNIPTPSGGGGGDPTLPTITTPTISALAMATNFNQSGTFSKTNATQGVVFSDTSTSSPSGTGEGIVGSYPGSPFTATGLFTVPLLATSFSEFGIIALASLTGKALQFNVQNSGTNWRINIGSTNSPTSYNADLLNTAANLPANGGRIWLQYKDDGTNIHLSVSGDGWLFQQVYTVSRASSWLGGSGFVFFGIGMNQQGTYPLAFSLMSWNVTFP